jgi:hypothetical protein
MNLSATVKCRLRPGPGDVVSRLAAEARRAAAQHLHPLLEAIRQDARLFVLYRRSSAAARRGQHVVVIETLAPQRDAWCEFVAERAPAATITLAEWSRVVCIRVIRTKKAA